MNLNAQLSFIFELYCSLRGYLIPTHDLFLQVLNQNLKGIKKEDFDHKQ